MGSTLVPLAATLTVQVLVAMALVTVPVLAPAAAADLGVPASLVGIFTSIAYAGSMAVSLVAGGLVLRYGAIRQSQVGLVTCALGLACVAAGHPVLLVVGAILLGAGYGPVTPAGSHILAKTSPPGRMGLVFSLKQTGVPLGGALAGLLVPALVLWGGWRVAAMAVAVACLAVALLTQPLRASLDADRDPHRRITAAAVVAMLRLTLSDPMLRRLAWCSLCFAGLQLCLVTFLVTYVTSELGFSLVKAGLMLAAAQVGGVVGRIGWGMLADRWGRPMQLLGIMSFAMGLAALASAAFSPAWSTAWIVVVCAAFGATAIGWNGVYLAQVARVAPPGQVGIATGGTLFFTYAGVLVGPSVFAALLGAGLSYGWAFVVVALPSVASGAWLVWRTPDERSAPVARAALEKP